MWAQNCVLHTKDTQMIRDFLPWAFLELMFSQEQRHDSHIVRGGAGCSHGTPGGESWADRRRGICSFPFKLKWRRLIFSKCLPEAAQEKRSLPIQAHMEQLTRGFPKHGQTSLCFPRTYGWPVFELHRSTDMQIFFNKHIKYEIQGWSEANFILYVDFWLCEVSVLLRSRVAQESGGLTVQGELH